MNSTEVLITIALAVQGWTLLEVIGLKTRIAVLGARTHMIEARCKRYFPACQVEEQAE